MTALDLRHLGRSRPHGDDVDQDAYASRYQNDQLAANLQDEHRLLSAAQAQAQYNGVGLADLAGLMHLVLQDSDARRPRQSMHPAAVGRRHLSGKPWPITSTRARDSCFDDDENGDRS